MESNVSQSIRIELDVNTIRLLSHAVRNAVSWSEPLLISPENTLSTAVAKLSILKRRVYTSFWVHNIPYGSKLMPSV